jgi:hypothetical protein
MIGTPSRLDPVAGDVVLDPIVVDVKVGHVLGPPAGHVFKMYPAPENGVQVLLPLTTVRLEYAPVHVGFDQRVHVKFPALQHPIAEYVVRLVHCVPETNTC